MSESLSRSHWIERFYGAAIWLYPFRFRADYGDAMRQCLRDALDDPGLPISALAPTLVLDLMKSLAKENLAVIRGTFSRPALVFNALVLTALSFILFLGIYVIPQQVLRQGANDPQIELAGNLANRLQHGTAPVDAVPKETVDMDASLSTFVTAFDEQGKVLASSGELNGAALAPPRGVFDRVRQNGEFRLTWAPRRDVRIAAVLRHVPGPQGGFVLAGRNLREVEARIANALSLAQLCLLAMLGVIAFGTFLFGWLTRAPRPVTA